ncbi:MAG: amino acid permease, partial [Candidatus Magasanikbacteria bacterium CG_4_10_14_0_2_um_filter_41_10]
MFFRRKKPESLSDLTMHQGIFRPRITLFEGIALMLSGTIGAGVLGLPYAVAKSGVLIG